MPVPKRKRSRARRDKRFANKGISVKAFTYCKTCQEPIMPHTACKGCGHYKGVKVMTTKKDRAEKRGSEKKRLAKKAQAKQADAVEVVEPKESSQE